MSIEERILNDNSCSPYVDKGRGYVEIAFKDGAYWGYEKGCKDMIDKACEILENVTVTYHKRFFGKCEENAFDADFIEDFRRAMEE